MFAIAIFHFQLQQVSGGLSQMISLLHNFKNLLCFIYKDILSIELHHLGLCTPSDLVHLPPGLYPDLYAYSGTKEQTPKISFHYLHWKLFYCVKAGPSIK